mmetsp:Transcript_83173/g.166096  ORF Transcript_83173/g.166096 Transcript_83173/m.166096 type:complete len:87 (-) Transcript_83173:30-290(-)
MALISTLTLPQILVAHERSKTLEPGWYIGTVKLFGDGISAAWKKVCPTANFPYQIQQEGDEQRSGWRLCAEADQGQLGQRRVVAAP